MARAREAQHPRQIRRRSHFAYNQNAKLIGERIYDDAASYRYERLDVSAVVTPVMAREQLAPLLARATLD
jgi:hypothetical protein